MFIIFDWIESEQVNFCGEDFSKKEVLDFVVGKTLIFYNDAKEM